MFSEFYTPPEITERIRRILGQVDLDPASCHYSNEFCVKAGTYFTQADDGFRRRWWGRVYLNPPSGKGNGRKTMPQWWDKLCAEYLAGRVEAAVFCAFHSTLFRARLQYVHPTDRPVAFVKRQVQWVRPDGRRVTIGKTTSFVLLCHDEQMVGRFASEFRDVAGVVGPLSPHL